MQLQTSVRLQPPNFQISHEDKILSIGSCFAQNMAQQLHEAKFQVVSNPFGILYNPLSIADGLGKILDKKSYQPSDLFLHNERWHCFDCHSDFSGATVSETLCAIQTALETAHQQLLNAKVLLVTLGSAFVYHEKKTARAVANCHKLPSAHFEKRLATSANIVADFQAVINRIQAVNPSLYIIFTLSPVRHIRDGIIENQKSKATLLLALHELTAIFKNTYYFPSYEIVLDELRDYRFYEADMLHPSPIAIQYIWERFANIFFNETTQQRNAQFKKLRQAFLHRPFHAASALHQQFLQKQLAITEQYQQQFPYLSFEKEIEHFKHNN